MKQSHELDREVTKRERLLTVRKLILQLASIVVSTGRYSALTKLNNICLCRKNLKEV